MKFIDTALPGVIVIEPDVFGDHRGFFMETWHRSRFSDGGIDVDFVQDNHSRSLKHTLRGLHYQINRPQGKLVRVIAGEVFDVVVDIRRSSPCFGRWAGELLSADNRRMLWVPPGFAHGFLVTSDSAEVCYKCTDYYAPQFERSVLWNDADIDISWPLQNGIPPLLSDKDRNGQRLSEAEVFE
jgi:dTDP-4-dehydrorhamnose 3,5-epimerase